MITESDLKYLRLAGCSESVIDHSVAVTEKALEIADNVNVEVDRDLVKRGALHHDIGRSRSHDLDHFIVGAAIATELGMKDEIVRIIERHLGAGVPKEEAVIFGFPPKDYLPETYEEIIVSYADNLTHHVTHVSFEEAFSKFKTRLGEDHSMLGRFTDMHYKVLSWMSEVGVEAQ
jgi:uncharacterized protein